MEHVENPGNGRNSAGERAEPKHTDVRLTWSTPVLERLSVKSTETSQLTFVNIDADANYS